MQEIREKLTEAHRLTVEARARLEELARRAAALKAELADAASGAPPAAAAAEADDLDLPPIPRTGTTPPPIPEDAFADFDPPEKG